MLSQLGEGMREWLEMTILEEEVRDAILTSTGDKAPRLDGFTIAFFSGK